MFVLKRVSLIALLVLVVLLTGAFVPVAHIQNWRGEYFTNQNLSGTPTLVRDDSWINFKWGTGGPDWAIPTDHFSVRWTRSLDFSEGTWRFTTSTDDGVRLWVDNNLIIDAWYDQANVSRSADIWLGGGSHGVRMEYFEDSGGATANLSYSQPGSGSTSGGAWYGQYYNNVSLQGAPAMTRYDAAVDFDWGTGSPGTGVSNNYFSAKWDSSQSVPTSGNYVITATADDGVRVWADGQIVIDAWYDHPVATFTGQRWLAAGAHNIHVEYYDRTVTARISVQIAPAPAPAPPPVSDIIIDNGGRGWQAGGSGDYWHAVTRGYGGSFLRAYNDTYPIEPYAWARWYPSVTRAGNYQVYAYIPGGVATTGGGRYWIYHNGDYDLAIRNQTNYSNQWVSLGTFYFSGQGGENVSLTAVTGECFRCSTVVFDAIKFSPR